MATKAKPLHYLLGIDPHNGKVVIRGSRLRLQRVIGHHLEGRSPEEIAESYPGLTLPAVYAALSYYYEHKSELDDEEEREALACREAAKELGAGIR